MDLDTLIALVGGALLWDGLCSLVGKRSGGGGGLVLAALYCFAYVVLQR